ncbi:Solute carrier 38 member [Perkinsus olseni]|uniref:Solute carrier 38 member n=1 Tax=Perkinsus olseni TaxID=32597 RepID=A0A7J6SNA3_PEROL|nr:Solute carrier 38 member [Perkinsus olseni]
MAGDKSAPLAGQSAPANSRASSKLKLSPGAQADLETDAESFSHTHSPATGPVMRKHSLETAPSFSEPLLNTTAGQEGSGAKASTGKSSMAVSIINCIKNIIGAGNNVSSLSLEVLFYREIFWVRF